MYLASVRVTLPSCTNSSWYMKSMDFTYQRSSSSGQAIAFVLRACGRRVHPHEWKAGVFRARILSVRALREPFARLCTSPSDVPGSVGVQRASRASVPRVPGVALVQAFTLSPADSGRGAPLSPKTQEMRLNVAKLKSVFSKPNGSTMELFRHSAARRWSSCSWYNERKRRFEPDVADKLRRAHSRYIGLLADDERRCKYSLYFLGHGRPNPRSFKRRTQRHAATSRRPCSARLGTASMARIPCCRVHSKLRGTWPRGE